MKKSKTCPICKKPIGRNKICCSRSCYAIYRSNQKACAVCGKKFYDSKSNDTVCCSPECSKMRRHKLGLQGTFNKGLCSAHKAIQDDPRFLPCENHINAKTWVIQSPDGTIYRCHNLKNWLREHKNMIDGSVNQAWDGISKIKYSMEGKRKFKSYQWKGWRLLDWGDE